MKPHLILLSFLILSVWTCQLQQSNPTNNPYEQVVFVDTCSNKKTYLSSEYSTQLNYTLVGIGNKNDTIRLNHYGIWEEIIFSTFTNKNKIANENVSFFIDTTRLIAKFDNSIPPAPPPPSLAENESIRNATTAQETKPNEPSPINKITHDYFSYFMDRPFYLSYPVFIENISSDTIIMNNIYFLPLTLQAKDTSGHWLPIEYNYIPNCGNDNGEWFLPPNKIIVTACTIFEGNYRTQFRLKYGYDKPIYSNTFWGNMNYGQFQRKKVVY